MCEGFGDYHAGTNIRKNHEKSKLRNEMLKDTLVPAVMFKVIG